MERKLAELESSEEQLSPLVAHESRQGSLRRVIKLQASSFKTRRGLLMNSGKWGYGTAFPGWVSGTRFPLSGGRPCYPRLRRRTYKLRSGALLLGGDLLTAHDCPTDESESYLADWETVALPPYGKTPRSSANFTLILTTPQ